MAAAVDADAGVDAGAGDVDATDNFLGDSPSEVIRESGRSNVTMSQDSATSSLRLPEQHSRIPVLDGVRGLAVLLVLFCHATMLTDLPGSAGKLYLALARISWCGVDLFFALSGFLITGILFDAKGKQNFFRNFYARRTVRIFPLYYACLLYTSDAADE